MTEKLTKVKNGSIQLPRQIKKQWQGATVFVSGSGDTLLVKRVSQPTLSLADMAKEFREAAKQTKLTRKDITRAITAVRR